MATEGTSNRDVLGTSSIDDLIDNAVLANQVASIERDSAKRKENQERRLVEIDATRAAKGLGPGRSGRYLRADGGGVFYPIAKGQTVADTPGLAETWRPEYNDGKLATEVGAGYGRTATWVCDEHEAEGHLHVWTRRVIDRATRRTGCPYCAHREACPSTALATVFPDMIANEWDTGHNELNPTTIVPGCNNDAWWKCASHGLYKMRINARTTQGQGCRVCASERRAEAASRKIIERAKEARRAAKAVLPQRLPPMMDSLPEVPAGADVVTVKDAAAILGRSRGTIINWIRAGRVVAVTNKDGVAPKVPAFEVERLRTLLEAS